MGRHVTDCVGLIKSYLWSQTGELKYDSSSDVSANGMYNKASEKDVISTIPEVAGLCVWKNGHIGVYIGGGWVIESHGTKYGVIKTPLKGTGATKWTHWLECPFIDYVNPQPQPKPQPKPSKPQNPMVLAYQKAVNAMGIKDKNGNKLELDGVLGELTLSTIPNVGNVNKGDKSPIVAWIQSVVNCQPDSIFGRITEARVKAFQKAHSLVVDGIVGKNTITYMLKNV